MNKGNNPSADTRRPDRAALVIAAVLAAIAGVIFWDVSRLSGLAGYSQVGPMTVPYAIACCLIALAVWTAVEAGGATFPNVSTSARVRLSGSSPGLRRRCCS